MVDTSKMTADEYKAFTDAKAAGRKPAESEFDARERIRDEIWKDAGNPEKLLPKAQGESVSQFKPGQTVWLKNHPMGYKPVSIAHISPWAEVCIVYGDQSIAVVKAEDLTTTDPNAKPEPQACPFCGGKASFLFTSHPNGRVMCGNYECAAEGPVKSEREEAIQAWNSISTKQVVCAECCDAPAVPVNCFCQFCYDNLQSHSGLAGDSAPLTEEWLRKVGLWEGLHSRFDNGEEADEMVSVSIPQSAEHTSIAIRESSDRDAEFLSIWSPNIKTIGDARTLCRLLGVDLKE